MNAPLISIQPISTSQPGLLPEVLGFGRHFTHRMFTQIYTPEQGWHNASIGPYQPISLDPAGLVFHSGQAIFEGTKAYPRPDGQFNLFRVDQNAARFNRSATRLSMPNIDPDFHAHAISELVKLEKAWMPYQPGSALYVRPVMIATDPTLEVRASKNFLHYIILSPASPYFSVGAKAVRVLVSHEYVRAVRGGTGEAKTTANYAISLHAIEQARAQGYQQVLWLDALERRYVEEVGAMNIGFVYEGKHIRTPALSGSILPGITRDSILRLAPDLGFNVSEERIDIDEALRDIASGKITEVFAMGTAAVVVPVGTLAYKDRDYEVVNGESAPVAKALYKGLTDIQYGRAPDPYGWTRIVTVK
jgi:branched-chain amino acid aminotransferase